MCAAAGLTDFEFGLSNKNGPDHMNDASQNGVSVGPWHLADALRVLAPQAQILVALFLGPRHASVLEGICGLSG